MLASFEPETQKSTAALVGLKTVSDPLQFYNLQSTVAAVLEQKSTSSLPTGSYIFFFKVNLASKDIHSEGNALYSLASHILILKFWFWHFDVGSEVIKKKLQNKKCHPILSTNVPNLWSQVSNSMDI